MTKDDVIFALTEWNQLIEDCKEEIRFYEKKIEETQERMKNLESLLHHAKDRI